MFQEQLRDGLCDLLCAALHKRVKIRGQCHRQPAHTRDICGVLREFPLGIPPSSGCTAYSFLLHSLPRHALAGASCRHPAG